MIPNADVSKFKTDFFYIKINQSFETQYRLILNMIKTSVLLTGALLVTCLAFGQKSPDKPNAVQTLSLDDAIKNHGFPVKNNSGNALRDKQDYKAAKRLWVAQNPELYKKLTATIQPKTQPVLMDEKTYKAINQTTTSEK